MSRVRRFRIGDVMILVPAAAVGTLILRSYLPGFYQELDYLPTIAPDPFGFWRAHAWLRGPGSCLVVPWMAATIAIRLRRPRPRRFRVQPGFVACVAVMISLLPGLSWIATIQYRPGFRRPGGFQQAWVVTTMWSEAAVLGAWLALLLSRRWRSEPSWIDRMGRALGLYWILAFFVRLALDWLQVLQHALARWTS